MKRSFFLLFVLSLSALCGEEKRFVSLQEKGDPLQRDEVEVLERLIEVNEARIKTQKVLKEKMALFQRQKEEFILGNESKQHAYAMVSNARQILGVIQKEHLAYLFSSDYLDDLVFFSSIAGKSTPVRP